MTETAFKSATELAAMIRKREIGAEELLDLYFERIDKHNPALQVHRGRCAPACGIR